MLFDFFASTSSWNELKYGFVCCTLFLTNFSAFPLVSREFCFHYLPKAPHPQVATEPLVTFWPFVFVYLPQPEFHCKNQKTLLLQVYKLQQKHYLNKIFISMFLYSTLLFQRKQRLQLHAIYRNTTVSSLEGASDVCQIGRLKLIFIELL
jgi:hypothetical protein